MRQPHIVQHFLSLQSDVTQHGLAISCHRMDVYDNAPGFVLRELGKDDPIFVCDTLEDLQHFLCGYLEGRKAR